VQPPKVAIVGTGNVGATCAYALLMEGLASEVVLIDMNTAKAEGEAMDLAHALPLIGSAQVWAGDYSDCAGAAITIISAGASQKPGETRLDLLAKNRAVFREIIPQIVHYNPEGLLLVATNPVDALTLETIRVSGLPAERVIGSGTILDTARFRYLLSQHFEVDPQSVHAYIIGEHGDSEVPVWSLANIGGMRLVDYCNATGRAFEESDRARIYQQTREAAYQIISRKGATYYAVAAGLARIVQAILRNQHTVLSVSSLVPGYYGIQDLCLSLPCILGRSGIEKTLSLPLASEEIALLQKSAAILAQL
jgi:L-lactate dehydrogenase